MLRDWHRGMNELLACYVCCVGSGRVEWCLLVMVVPEVQDAMQAAHLASEVWNASSSALTQNLLLLLTQVPKVPSAGTFQPGTGPVLGPVLGPGVCAAPCSNECGAFMFLPQRLFGPSTYTK